MNSKPEIHFSTCNLTHTALGLLASGIYRSRLMFSSVVDCARVDELGDICSWAGLCAGSLQAQRCSGGLLSPAYLK